MDASFVTWAALVGFSGLVSTAGVTELHWGPDGQELSRRQRLLDFRGLCFKIVLFRLRSLQKHAVFESSTSKLAKTKPTDHSRAESLGVTYHGEKLVLKAALREQFMPHCSL